MTSMNAIDVSEEDTTGKTAEIETLSGRMDNIIDRSWSPDVYYGNADLNRKLELEYDIEQLIELSKRMQREFVQTLSMGCEPSDKSTTALEGGQRSVTVPTHRRFLVPPLFLNDAHVLSEYTKDLVAECFEQSNRRDVSENKNNSNTTKTVFLCPKVPDLNLKDIDRKSESPKIPSRRSVRVRPVAHSCVSTQNVAPVKRKVFGRSQSARAALSARVLKSDLELTASVCENESLEADNEMYKKDLVDSSSDDASKIEDENCVNNEEKETWHDVLCTNSNANLNEVPVAQRLKEVTEQPTQTSPQSFNIDLGESEKVEYSVTGCAIQVLPQLNIKGSCQIQHLPTISINKRNPDTDPAQISQLNTNYQSLDVIYAPQIQVNAQDKTVPLVSATPKSNPKQLVGNTSNNANHLPNILVPKMDASMDKNKSLTVSTMCSNSFGGSSNEQSKTDTSEYTTSFECDFNSSSVIKTTTTDEKSCLNTDDDKLIQRKKNLCKKEVKSVRSHSNQLEKTALPRQQISKTKDKVRQNDSISKPQADLPPPISESLMKIIEEIFESSNEDLSVRKPATKVASSTEVRTKNYALTPRGLVLETKITDSCVQTDLDYPSERDIQTRNQKIVVTDADCVDVKDLPKTNQMCTSLVNQLHEKKLTPPDNNLNEHIASPQATRTPPHSAVLRPSSSCELQSPFHPQVSEDIPDATPEMIMSSKKIYQIIRNRKQYLYKHEALPCIVSSPSYPAGQISMSSAEKTTSYSKYTAEKSASRCHYRSHMETQLKNASIKPPKNFNIERCSEHVDTPVKLSKPTPPSVRLHNLRQMQHQQLIESHPKILRTLSSIQKEVECGKPSDNTNHHSYRLQHPEDVQSAAQKFLNSIKSPAKAEHYIDAYTARFPSEYIDDTVQLEAEMFLKTFHSDNMPTSDSSSSARKLFQTESSSYENQPLKRLLCTNSETEQSMSISTLSSSSNGAMSILASPMKLSTETSAILCNMSEASKQTKKTTLGSLNNTSNSVSNNLHSSNEIKRNRSKLPSSTMPSSSANDPLDNVWSFRDTSTTANQSTCSSIAKQIQLILERNSDTNAHSDSQLSSIA